MIISTGCGTDSNPSLTEKDTNSLEGSCISGGSCTSPGCGQWIDQNKDGACDRGIKT